jgi:hypothetical protein
MLVVLHCIINILACKWCCKIYLDFNKIAVMYGALTISRVGMYDEGTL